nr:MAG TPA: hypothetical protein [Caudoviricetes sp.]
MNLSLWSLKRHRGGVSKIAPPLASPPSLIFPRREFS